MSTIRITITSENPATIEVEQLSPRKRKSAEEELRELLLPLLDEEKKQCS